MLSFENVFQRPSPVRVRVDASPEDFVNKKTVLRTVINGHLQMNENGDVQMSDLPFQGGLTREAAMVHNTQPSRTNPGLTKTTPVTPPLGRSRNSSQSLGRLSNTKEVGDSSFKIT
jgi:hypothetical protein